MPYLGRAPTGTGSVTEIDGDLKITGQLTANDTLFKMIMDTAANLGDNILIEDGGTDGSGTNAGDDICLEKDLQVVSSPEIVGGTGKILQVVQGILGSNSTVANSVTYATALSQAITLSSTSSKALVTFSLLLHSNDQGSSLTSQNVKLYRDSTVLHSTNDPIIVGLAVAGTGTANYIWGPYSYTFLDSPNSTSELTYKLQIAVQNGGTFRLNVSERNSSVDPSCSSTITAYEIAG